MKITAFIKKVINFLMNKYYCSSSSSYINFIRRQGINIGNDCIFRVPKTCVIDMTRPYLITIGNRVDMNINFKIYTHDWGSHVFLGKYGQMVNSSGTVNIGNNIYFGADCTILKGVTIGDNCIIGAGSVVTHSIPGNSVAAGNPCKVICSLDDYFKKRLQKAPDEAAQLINTFYKTKGRYPEPSELLEERIYFESSGKILHKFSSYQDFIKFCKDRRNI